MADVVAILAELKASMYSKEDGKKANEEIKSQFNVVAATLDAVVDRQTKAESCIDQLSNKFQELATSLDDVKGRLAAVEANTVDMDVGDGGASDSSGLPSRDHKKPRVEAAAGAGLGRSSPASWPRPSAPQRAGRASSTRLNPPPAVHETKGSKDDLVLAATGFGREVPRSLLQKFYDEIVKSFPPDVVADATFWSYPFARYFNIKFTEKKFFLTALDHFKQQATPYEWYDKMEETKRNIVIRKDKTIEQRAMASSTATSTRE